MIGKNTPEFYGKSLPLSLSLPKRTFLAYFRFSRYQLLFLYKASFPNTVGYQGRLKNSAGTAQTGSFTFIFRFYASTTGGSALWTETQTVTVDSGSFAVLLGSSTAFPASLDFNAPLFLSTEVNGDGEMSPRITINTVPLCFPRRRYRFAGVCSFGCYRRPHDSMTPEREC